MNARDQVILSHSDLASVDADKFDLLNALYSSDDVESERYRWQWRRTSGGSVDHWVRLQCGRQQLWLGVIAATIDADVDFCWRDYDGIAARIAWSASYPQVLETAQLVFQRDWSTAEIVTDYRPEPSSVDAGFVIEYADECVASGRCCFGVDGIPRIKRTADIAATPFMHQLPVTIPIVVDRATFSVHELRSLEIGAVVRISRRAFLDIGALLRLNVGGTDFVVKVTGTTLTVIAVETGGAMTGINLEKKMSIKEIDIAEEVDACDGSQELATAPVDIAGMPVDIRFEAGRLVRRYDELCGIQPGYTYELGRTLGEQSIDITANGALIARGELVNIGDQLGVRITALGRVAVG